MMVGAHGRAPLRGTAEHPGGVGTGLALPSSGPELLGGRQAVPLQPRLYRRIRGQEVLSVGPSVLSCLDSKRLSADLVFSSAIWPQARSEINSRSALTAGVRPPRSDLERSAKRFEQKQPLAR